jgi:hypothetical protein
MQLDYIRLSYCGQGSVDEFPSQPPDKLACVNVVSGRYS